MEGQRVIANERITAVNVFFEIDGKQMMAFINPEVANLFLAMLPAVQTNQPKEPQLYEVPAAVAKHLQDARSALYDVLMKPKT